jgi:hypothetical protein
MKKEQLAREEAQMEIKLNSNYDSVVRLTNSQPKASRPVEPTSALSEFEESNALEARIKALPDTRADNVDRAKKLVGDPAYPPRETIQRLAALLAIESGKNSDPSEN